MDPGPLGPRRGDPPADRDPGGRRARRARAAARAAAPAPEAFRGPCQVDRPGRAAGPRVRGRPPSPAAAAARSPAAPPPRPPHRSPAPAPAARPPPRSRAPRRRTPSPLRAAKAAPVVVTAVPKTTEDKNRQAGSSTSATNGMTGTGARKATTTRAPPSWRRCCAGTAAGCLPAAGRGDTAPVGLTALSGRYRARGRRRPEHGRARSRHSDHRQLDHFGGTGASDGALGCGHASSPEASAPARSGSRSPSTTSGAGCRRSSASRCSMLARKHGPRAAAKRSDAAHMRRRRR